MGIFKKEADPTIHPKRTMSGKAQTQPEQYGGWPRRQRFFLYVGELLRDNPVCSAEAFGNPLGDGLGMEEVVAVIRPLFATEKSLLKWVALRGAIHAVSELGVGWGDSALAASVGLKWDGGLGGFVLADSSVPEELSGAAVGVASSVYDKAIDYSRISSLSIEEVLADPGLSSLSDSVLYDYIAWAAVSLNRLESNGYLPPLSGVPEPSQLEEPGFYVDPVFAAASRYWDGTDWKRQMWLPAQMRRNKRLPEEFELPI